MTRPARFCIVWLASLCLILLLVGGFCALVDPYDVVGAPRIAGLNEFKFAAPSHTALAKVHQVIRIRPVTVLLGSSIVNIGLNPRDPLWPADMRPIYNFGIPSLGPRGTYRSLRYAASLGTVHYAIVALQFETFLAQEPEDGDRDIPDDWRALPRWKQLFQSTLTLSALGDSIETVLHQRDPIPLDLAPDGSIGETAFRRLARRDGEAALFAQSEEIETKDLGKAVLPHPWNGQVPDLNYVRDIIRFCDRHNIQLTFFLPPTHAIELDMVNAAGLWNVYEAWKTSLAQLVSEHRDRPIPLWDFGGYTRYAAEPVPTDRGPKAQTEWFWEIVHFKRSLGDMILSRILTGQPANFGHLLTAANVADMLARERSARDCRAGKAAGSSDDCTHFSYR